MKQFVCSSEKVRNTVLKFMEKASDGSASITPTHLVVSLYSLENPKDYTLLEVLDDYRLNLSSFLTEEEILFLQGELKEAVACCEELEMEHQYSPWTGPLHRSQRLVINLCTRLADQLSTGDILLPYAGIGQFAFFEQAKSIEGYEPSRKAWSYSQILCKVFESKAHLVNGYEYALDGFYDAAMNKKYDLILSVPNVYGDGEEQVYFDLFDSLKPGGKLICALPNECHFSIKERRFFCNAIEGIQMTCIHLNGESPLFDFAERRVFIFENNGTDDASVKHMLTDAELYLNEHGTLCLDRFFDAYQSVASEYFFDFKDNFWEETINQEPPLRRQARCYSPQPKPEETVYALRDLISVVPSHSFYMDDFGKDKVKEICYGNLSRTFFNDNKVDTDSLKESQGLPWWCERRDGCIPCDAGNILLVGYEHPFFRIGSISDEQVEEYRFCPEGGVIPIQLKANNIITEDFLLRSFLSEEMSRQASRFLKRLVWSTQDYLCLETEDFLNLKISVPSLEKQKEVCAKEAVVSKSESEVWLKKLLELFDQDLHSKKHALGQTLADLRNWLEILSRAREENGGVLDDNNTIGKRRPIKVAQVHERINGVLHRLEKQISAMDKTLDNEATLINPSRFVTEYIESYPSPEFRYEFHTDIPSDNYWIEFSKESLVSVFNHIVHNACDHGFAGSNKENVVKIDVFEEKGMPVITIANNGAPIPTQMTDEMLFSYGGTTSQGKGEHLGLGGYELKQQMDHFNGKVAILRSPKEEYTVAYKLSFFHKITFSHEQ